MSGRIAIGVVAALVAIGAAAALFVWVYRGSGTPPQTGLKPIPVSPAPQAAPAPRLSTIIDLPGDPALARRAALKGPRQLALAAPARLAPGALPIETEAYYLSEALTPAGGGYLGKFTGDGQEADALNAELAMNSAQPGATAEDAGDDDDGGEMTSENAPVAAPLSGANSQQLEAVAGGDNGRPWLREVVLRPKLAQKISELLVESGFEETSAAAVEAASKRLFNIQSLRVGAVAIAVGAVDLSGVYRVTQLAIYEDGEYAGTVALGETGLYEEGAEPKIPQGLLDDDERPALGARFTLADGVYSAGLRSAAPEPVIREAVRLLQRLADLDAPLAPGEALRLLYARSPRSKSQAASRVIYAGLAGPALTVDCYAFELSDGTYRCFNPKEAADLSAVPSPSTSNAPTPPERNGKLADSGAVAADGLLAPIRGAPITSLFGMRFHPILHITRLHAGIDFGAPVGSQIRAAADGVVESAGESHGYGERIVLKHGGFSTTYNHLSEVRVEIGAKVRQGEIIALSGNSGLSTGPHLHFEYLVNGEPVDPLPHMGKEVQSRVPVAGDAAPVSTSATARPVATDPATLAVFAAAKAEIDAALAEGER